MHEYAQEYDYSFYCLTASGKQGIQQWRDRTGSEYLFCQTDDIVLKTMIRSNPGLMLLKDGNGQYIWKPGIEVGKPDTILGHEVYTSTYMPAIEGVPANDAGKKVLLFGDFDYYWIADRTNRTMKRLNELYAMTDQVGFVGTQRVDGKLILPEAMKVLGMGANC